MVNTGPPYGSVSAAHTSFSKTVYVIARGFVVTMWHFRTLGTDVIDFKPII